MASTTPDVPTDALRGLPPATVLVAAGIAVLQAVAIVAAALTSLGGLFATPGGSGAMAALCLIGLAAWAVSGAGGGLLLADGSGSRLLVVVACAELGVLVVFFLVALASPSLDDLAPGLPTPALALLALAVPIGKLLLATAPSATAWSAAGPRRPLTRPQLGPAERTVRVVTVGLIGLVLASVALLDPVGSGAQEPWPATTGQH